MKGAALFFVETGDRLTSFLLPRDEAVALLFGPAPFDGEQFGFPRHLFEIVARSLELQLEGEDGFLLAVKIAADGR